jgi:hypothetical protein
LATRPACVWCLSQTTSTGSRGVGVPLAASQALGALAQLDESAQFDGALVFTRPRPGSPDLYRLLPTSELSRQFLGMDLSQAEQWSVRPGVNYIPGRQIPDGHLMYVHASEVQVLTSLALDNVAGRTFPLFDPGSDEIGQPRMVMTMMSQGPLQSTFVRFMRPAARLARSGLVATVFRGAAFDVLHEEVLLFRESVDAIVTGGWVFFANRNNFDRSFEFLARMQERAAAIFETITAHIEIKGIEELRAAATSDINMMAKLSSIQRKIDGHPEYVKALETNRLLEFVDHNPHIDVDVAGDGPERQLLFVASPQRRWKILKLLDDDYLTSNLTALDYEIDSKGDPLE